MGARWMRLRFRYRVAVVAAATGLLAGLVTWWLAAEVGEGWAVGWLMLVSALTEVGAVLIVVADVRRRRRVIGEYLSSWRSSMSGPMVDQGPIHAVATVLDPYRGRFDDETAKRIHGLEVRVRAMEMHIRTRIARQVNEAVEAAKKATDRGDKRLEAFVVRALDGERGWSRLGVTLLVVGIVIGAIANVWSLSL